jgi:hypothetical protein
MPPNIVTKLHVVDWPQARVTVPRGRLWMTQSYRLMMALSREVPIMAEPAADVGAAALSPLRSWIVRHPIATFLVLVYATTTALVIVPKGLTEPGLLPGGATPHGVLENVLGSAVPAFIVAALVSGKAGVRDLAGRSFRWRVPLRWYLISLLAPLLIFLIAVTILYGFAPLRALTKNWLLLSPHSCRHWRS